jgi:hypothetical protein
MSKIVFVGNVPGDGTVALAAMDISSVTVRVLNPDLAEVKLAENLRVHVRTPEQADRIAAAFRSAAEGLQLTAVAAELPVAPPVTRRGQWPAGEGAQ